MGKSKLVGLIPDLKTSKLPPQPRAHKNWNIQGPTVATGATGLTGATGPAGVGLNPLQVATLRWYESNQAFPHFTVGNKPYAVASDGTNIWVANNGSSNVTKLKASDGSLVGTYAVGSSPIGVAFDGSNIWVANYGSSNSVSRL